MNGLYSVICTLFASVLVSAQPGHLEWIEDIGLNSGSLWRCDDCSSGIILLSSFPFGNTSHSRVHVSSNGLISFESEYSSFAATQFPSTSDSNLFHRYVVAPYWTDNDPRYSGDISWEMYSQGNSFQSDIIMGRINSYIQRESGMAFNGVFVFVATWSMMQSFPAAINVYKPNNTIQGVLITDGVSKSFAIFTYQCGAMEWSGRRSTIGFNAGGHYYVNHPLSSTLFSNSVSCLNQGSEWNNVVYDLMSAQQPIFEESEPAILCSRHSNCTDFFRVNSILGCCGTEGMTSYIAEYQCHLCDLEWLEKTGLNGGSLRPCDDCTSNQITLLSPFSIGNTLQTSAYVSANGVIYFGLYHQYWVAPYWTDNDPRHSGNISWEIYSRGDNYNSSLIIDRVTLFIKNTHNIAHFNGTFLFVVNWTEMQQYPAHPIPYDIANNSYQAVLVTDGERSFAIFTYMCGEMEWARSGSTIGFNAGRYYATHPLTNTPFSNAIACLNNRSSVWTNIMYDLTNSTSSIIYTRADSDSVLCSNGTQCTGFFIADSTYSCCSMYGAYTYISENHCYLCFEYGWVEEMSPSLLNYVELSQINATEGDTLNLTVYFLKNGPISRDSYLFNITTGGTAKDNVDYSLNATILDLTDFPITVTLSIVDDDACEKEKNISLVLTQTDSTNTVTGQLSLTAQTLLVIIKDNDFVTIGFERENYTVNEGGLLEMTVNKSVPCDFDIHFHVYSPGLIDEDVIFRPTENRVLIGVNLTDDGVAMEPDEIHVLTLSLVVSDPQVLLWPNISCITILDNDIATIGFERENYTVSEGGLLEVAVNKSVPCDADIHCRVYSTGLIDEDVIFRPTENRILIGVNLTDNGVALEPDEIHVLTLSLVVSDPQVLLQPNISYITIADNDNNVTVGFNEANVSVSEDVGTFSVSIDLMNEAAVPVSVDLTTISNTAVDGQDFIVRSCKLIFVERGNQVCYVEIINDLEYEADETFYLTLFGAHPPGSIILDPDIILVKIEANDEPAQPQSSISLLPILMPVIIVALAIIVTVLVVILFLRRRKKKAAIDLAIINTTNPLEEEHVYDIPDIKSGKPPLTVPQIKPTTEDKDDDKEQKRYVGSSVSVLPPLDQCQRKLSVSGPKYAAEPRRDHGGVALVGIAGQNSDFKEPETQENVAYGMVQLQSSEYADPQLILHGIPARPRMNTSEAQSVEAYAISTL